jgi:hypothetical protein
VRNGFHAELKRRADKLKEDRTTLDAVPSWYGSWKRMAEKLEADKKVVARMRGEIKRANARKKAKAMATRVPREEVDCNDGGGWK